MFDDHFHPYPPRPPPPPLFFLTACVSSFGTNSQVLKCSFTPNSSLSSLPINNEATFEYHAVQLSPMATWNFPRNWFSNHVRVYVYVCNNSMFQAYQLLLIPEVHYFLLRSATNFSKTSPKFHGLYTRAVARH